MTSLSADGSMFWNLLVKSQLGPRDRWRRYMKKRMIEVGAFIILLAICTSLVFAIAGMF